jgi:hypothetical protein
MVRICGDAGDAARVTGLTPKNVWLALPCMTSCVDQVFLCLSSAAYTLKLELFTLKLEALRHLVRR